MGLFDRLFAPTVAKLEKKGDMDGIKTLLESSDADSGVRIEAIQALARLAGSDYAETLVIAFSDDDPKVAEAAVSAVRGLGCEALPAIGQALGDQAGEVCLEMLVSLGEAGTGPLSEAFQSQNAEARYRALTGLMRLDRQLGTEEQHEASFRVILAALGDRSAEIRVFAAELLTELGDARACRALAAQLKDGDETVRNACRSALESIGIPALPNLLGAVEDRNANSRRLAAKLLGDICGGDVEPDDRRRALSALADHAGDSDPDVASAVSEAIAAIPRDEVVRAQLNLFADPDRYDHEDIREFLEQMLEHGALDADLAKAVQEILNSEPDQGF